LILQKTGGQEEQKVKNNSPSGKIAFIETFDDPLMARFMKNNGGSVFFTLIPESVNNEDLTPLFFHRISDAVTCERLSC
jgi:hypothetical protein